MAPLRFREQMIGNGDQVLDITVSTEGVGSFLSDPEHRLDVVGSFMGPEWIHDARGTLSVFPNGKRTLDYTLRLTGGGWFRGIKYAERRDGVSGLTTLYAVWRRRADTDIQFGVLHFRLRRLPALLASMEGSRWPFLKFFARSWVLLPPEKVI